MKSKAVLGVRSIMGLIFVVFGLNGFLQFLPMPPLPEAAGQMMGGFAASGYFFPFLKSVEIICGALLLSNRFVPLALVILAPVILNIFLFHAFLAPSGMAMPVFLLLGCVFLARAYGDHYKAVLVSRAQPK